MLHNHKLNKMVRLKKKETTFFFSQGTLVKFKSESCISTLAWFFMPAAQCRFI